MSTSIQSLTFAVRDALRSAPGLADVQVADRGGSVPANPLPAGVLMLSRIRRSADAPTLDGLWQVRYDLTIWRRDSNRAANAVALQSLADRAVAALLVDDTLAGLCVPGPADRAIEVLAVVGGKQPADPLGSLTVRIACWIMPADAISPAGPDRQVLIDGSALLASGPHRLTVSAWHRRRVDRNFAGLDGTVSVDLGATLRPLRITGRLVGESADDLLDQVAAVESVADAETHTLHAADGRTFDNVRLDGVRWGAMVTLASGLSAVGYELTFSQLGNPSYQ